MSRSHLLRAWPFAVIALLAAGLALGLLDRWAWLPAVAIILVGFAAAVRLGTRARRPRPTPHPDDGDEDEDGDARGWDAITQAADGAHLGIDSVHVAYSPGVHFGSPLQGASAYPAGDHWFYVSYGLTELWGKNSTDPEVSGFGYELTMRVPRTSDAARPPQWPFGLLSTLAGYARNGPQVLLLGDRVNVVHPLDAAPTTTMTTLSVGLDPLLGPLATPNGRVEFWQLVGFTPDDVEEAKRTSTEVVHQRLAATHPLLVTDPTRMR